MFWPPPRTDPRAFCAEKNPSLNSGIRCIEHCGVKGACADEIHHIDIIFHSLLKFRVFFTFLLRMFSDFTLDVISYVIHVVLNCDEHCIRIERCLHHMAMLDELEIEVVLQNLQAS